MLTANEIRSQYIDFFVKKHGHTFVPSSSVVPLDDPTLLFANAGMNQFKPIFLGLEKRAYSRAVNTQKCIRAGGKHNDLDDVGKDTYHHTFFEMLGNWSFGDYFKKEAVRWAWELLTDVWGLDRSRLHVTVFGGDKSENLDPDDEAKAFWISEAGVDPSHIHYGSKKDNFWEMGSTGPCGPCTEIHIDRTPDKSGGKLVNAGYAEVMEIWNLVFIQYNRGEDGKLTLLPAKHVDTGMGFERVTAVLQGKDSNYDTDVFTPILDAISKLVGKTYTGDLKNPVDIAFRAIADHLRMSTFAITDGARPGNKKRSAVLRSVIRRAVRFGYQFMDRREPFLFSLVPVLFEHMGQAFPELLVKPQETIDVIKDEEKGFLRTIKNGLTHFGSAVEKAKTAGGVVDGASAAVLHHTHGFPIDMTEQMALEMGLSVDRKAYEEAMEHHRITAGQGREKMVVEAIKGELPVTSDSAKYQSTPLTTKVVGWVKDNTVIRQGTLQAGDSVALLLEQTNFYAEQGGQVGDLGTISGGGAEFEVEDTQRLGDSVLHIGTLQDGVLNVGQTITATVSPVRRDTMRNHTATHMMNFALRAVLGGNIDQKGSLVDAEKTRFDFSYDKPLTAEQIRDVEQIVNQQIQHAWPVSAHTMPLAEAKKLPGVRAVFGEKYPDPVRVVLVGAANPDEASENVSVEFCGGTHLSNTSEAGFFKITSQENVSKGVRRITAVTGSGAVRYVQKATSVLSDLTSKLNCSAEELPKRIEALQDEIKKLQKQLAKGSAGDLNGATDQLVAKAEEIKGVKLVIGEVPGAPIETMRNQIDRLFQKGGACVIVLGWKNDDDTAGLAVGVSAEVIKKGIKSNDIIKPVAEVIGGKGGGPPHLATAGGKDANKLSEALSKAVQLGKELLSK